MPNPTYGFFGNTNIWCSAGYYMPLEKAAKIGNTFMTDAFDEEQQFFVTEKTVVTKTTEPAKMITVSYHKHGLIQRKSYHLSCSENQQFLMYDKKNKPVWIEAKQMTPGMKFVTQDDTIIVDSVDLTMHQTELYCITTSETNNITLEDGIIAQCTVCS